MNLRWRKLPQNHHGALNTQLRGGGSAGGSSATKRKQREKVAQQEVLTKLCNMLGSLIGSAQPSTVKKKKKKKKKLVDSDTSGGKDAALVDQLSKLVDDIRTNPSTLISKLEAFLHTAKKPSVVQPRAASSETQQSKWVDVVKTASTTAAPAKRAVPPPVTLARQCWNAGEVRDFGEVRAKLENGQLPLGSVALAPSVDKALEVRQLAEAHKLDSVKFACLVVGANESSLPAGATLVTLPVVTSTGSGVQHTKFQKMVCVSLGKEAPVLPTGLVKQVESVPAAKELITLRFVVPRAFLSKEQWQLWNSKATTMIQEWAGCDKKCSIHTSYGWAVTSQSNWKGDKEDFLLGYAKVPVDNVVLMLSHSGRSGVFLDRLAKERDRKQFVSWVDCGKLLPVEYLKTVQTTAKQQSASVAWRAGGGNCLGVRSAVAPSDTVVSVWRAKAVPFAWSEADLFQVLKDAGWSDLVVLAYPTKKVRPWLIKAKPPSAVVGGFAGVEVGKSLLVMEKAGARGPVNRESKKLKLQPRVGASVSAITPNAVEVVQGEEEVAATQLDEEMEVEGEGASAGAGTKRVGSPPASAEHVRKKEKTPFGAVHPRRLKFPGFTVRDCGADGSCGFNSIAVGAALMRGGTWEDVQSKKAAMGATLRFQVGQHISKNEATYKPLWSPDVSNTTVEKEDGVIPTDWSSWLLAIRRHKRWICGLTIKAAATRLGIKIIVVLKQEDQSWGLPMAFGSTKKKEHPIVIGLDEKEGHYILLVPDSLDMIPKDWLTAGQCEVTMTSQNVLRGAGDSDGDQLDLDWLPPSTPDSRHTVQSKWLPPVTPGGTSHVASSCKDWLPEVTPSRAKSSVLPGVSVVAIGASVASSACASVAATEAREAEMADSCVEAESKLTWTCVKCLKVLSGNSVSSLKRKRRVHMALHANAAAKADTAIPVSVGPEPLVWTCHHCGQRFEAQQGTTLTSMRTNHLANRHPGEDKGHWRRELVDVVTTSAVLPLAQRAWTCIWCREGLPSLPRWQLLKSITAHLKQRHGRRKTSAAVSNKARGKLYRQDKLANPIMLRGKQELGRKLRQRANQRRNWQVEGHDLHVVEGVDWTSWHGVTVTKRLGAQGDTLLTCKNCLLVTRAQHKFKPCRGNHKVTTSQMGCWRQMSPANRLAVVEVWGMSLDEADQLFESAAASWRSNPTQLGHDMVEIFGDKKYITCRNCWFLRQAPGKLSQCLGRTRLPTKAQVATWKGLKAHRGLQAKFVAEWGVSLQVAAAWYEQKKPKRGLKRPASNHAIGSTWKHDVVEDGDVHPHPGPSWSVVSLNVGGMPGAWRALEELLAPAGLAVCALQEVAGSANELISLQRAALKLGYRFYHEAGKPTVGGWGETRHKGGVSLFVRSTLPQRPAFAVSGEFSQGVGAWVDGWLIGSLYCPPGHGQDASSELASLLLDAFTSEAVVPSQPWLLSGDFNQEPGSGPVETCMCCFGGATVACDKPTRWEGPRTIDWMITNRPRALSPPRLLDIVLSDHIAVMIDIDGVPHDVQLGRLRKTACLSCPSGVDREYWEKAVSEAWLGSDEVGDFLAHLQHGPLGSVQDDWDTFQRLLTCAVLEACASLSQNGFLTAAVRDACFRAAIQKPFKGQVAQHVVSSSTQAGLRHKVGDLSVRKLRRWLARCYEYKRLLCRSFQEPLLPAQASELEALALKLRARFGGSLSLRDVLGHIASLKATLQHHESSVKTRRLSDWRNGLATSDAALSRWLKSKINPVGASVAGLDGTVATTDVSAARMLFDFWTEFWNQCAASRPPLVARVQSMLDGVSRLAHCDWSVPSAQVLRNIACDNKGSCGPDGWQGVELAWLPIEVWECFRLLTKRWLLCGTVPLQMCESRMVCLPKPGKIRQDKVVSVQDTRPITVLSCWWRIWTSAWTRGVVRSWMREHVPAEFAVAHAVSTGEVVVDLLEHLSVHGYLMTLDFSKAFDCLDPMVTQEVLLHLGWPRELVVVLIKVWQDQRRWVSFQSHTHPVTLSGPSMPQGDPLGPVIMTIWAWLGWRQVERRCRPDSHIMSRVYVDDRSFASSRAWSVHERFHQWSWWSASVGLLENQAKAVAVASTPARRATLRRILPDVVANDVELLGSCSMVSRRGLLHKETARVDACMRVLTLLACARLSFERYLRACRQFAISKIAYGWIARAPPLYLCNQLWSRVHVGSRRIRAASVWLRAALFGGGMHLDVLFATQLVGVLGRLLMKRSLAWSTRGGSPVHALDAWLLSHGWSRVRNWVWEHALSSHTLDLSVASDPGALQHIIRDAWRAWCLKRHMSSSRRDAQLDCFGDHGYFRRIDWIATRKFAASGPEARAISAGSCFSPAALGGRVEGISTSCFWPGCQELGTFDHVAWSCPCRPVDVPIPPKPGEFLSSRFGWVVNQQAVDMVAVQSWLVHVQKTLWSHVHPS